MPATSLYRIHSRPIIVSLLALVVTACADPGGGLTSSATLSSASSPNWPSSSGSTSAATPTSSGSSGGVDSTDGDDSRGESGTTGSATTGSATTGSATTGVSATSGETGDPSTSGDAHGACQEACADDGDCLVDGVDQNLVCKDSRCTPGEKPGMCTSDLYCQAGLPNAFHFCDSSEDCPSGWCLDLENDRLGMCAYPPNAKNQCPYPNFEIIVELPTVEGDDRLVCIAEYTYCDPALGMEWAPFHYCGELPMPCTSNAECNNSPTAPVCSDDGTCICTEDAQCSTPGLPTCVAGRCSCTSDADCAVVDGADVCVDGACGCSSAAVCPKETHFDGTQPVCEPL